MLFPNANQNIFNNMLFPNANQNIYYNNIPRKINNINLKKPIKNKFKFDLPPASQFPFKLPNENKKKKVEEDELYFDDFFE